MILVLARPREPCFKQLKYAIFYIDLLQAMSLYNEASYPFYKSFDSINNVFRFSRFFAWCRRHAFVIWNDYSRYFQQKTHEFPSDCLKTFQPCWKTRLQCFQQLELTVFATKKFSIFSLFSSKSVLNILPAKLGSISLSKWVGLKMKWSMKMESILLDLRPW